MPSAASRRAGTITALALLALAGCACRRGGLVALRAPDVAALEKPAPDSFVVSVVSSRGPFELMVRRTWAPRGADRFHYLVRNGYYDGVRFFRVVKGFVAQFGIHGDTAVAAAWRTRRFADDSVRAANNRGTLTFATGGPNTRTTQLFINLVDNRRLDASGFAPIGEVTSGLSVVDSLYGGYGEAPPRGTGPDQERLQREGNAYLVASHPKLDSIVTARVTRRWP